MHLNSVSASTQTSPADVYQLPKSPISREKPAGRRPSLIPTTSSPIKTHLLKASPHNSHAILETYVSPTQTSFLKPTGKRTSPPKSGGDFDDAIRGVQLEFDDQPLKLDLDETCTTPDKQAVRRSRRSSVGTPLSYKEPSLNTKIRKGHQFFVKH